MSSPAPIARSELNTTLGTRAGHYWDTVNQYMSGKISRVEFEELVREVLDSLQLVQLHNAFIIAVLGSSLHHAPPTPPPDVPSGKPPRKRRRTLPYQGVNSTNGDAYVDGEDGSLRSARLKRWTVGMGRKERERVRNMETIGSDKEGMSRRMLDEIARERGVLVPEGSGALPPVQLAAVTRAPTLQHIQERMALISSQHNLNAPQSKSVTSLMMLAYEAKLKQLISQALTLTSTSQTITSIQLSSPLSQATSRILSASSFETLLTVRPAVLPNQSAAASRLMAEGSTDNRTLFDHEAQFKERHTSDPRWQILAMLAERSTVREELLASRS